MIGSVHRAANSAPVVAACADAAGVSVVTTPVFERKREPSPRNVLAWIGCSHEPRCNVATISPSTLAASVYPEAALAERLPQPSVQRLDAVF